jgi:hypothetical protein
MMPNLVSVDNIYLILGFIVPGLIAIFVRAQFLTGRSPPHSEAILSYFVISVIYYALVLPVIDVVAGWEDAGFWKPLAWLAVIFLGPAVLGGALGLNAQMGFVRRLANWFGMHPVHVMPTAWDWKFSSAGEHWVLVTLKDETKFAGFCGVGSFMSSDPNERDIYIEKVFDLDDDNNWIDCGMKGVLIIASEIKTIEFWPIQRGESVDVKGK